MSLIGFGIYESGKGDTGLILFLALLVAVPLMVRAHSDTQVEDGATPFQSGDDSATLLGEGTNMTITGGAGDDWIDVARFGNNGLGVAAGSGFGSNLAEKGLGKESLCGSGGAVDGPYI